MAEKTATEFFDLVEGEWWKLMQGDLLLESDPATGSLALHMSSLMRETVKDTKDALDQYDGRGEVIVGDVPEVEYARRVATAMAVLFYGGK